MGQRIIFENDNGGVSVITPLIAGIPVEQIAAVSVPFGKPFKIVDETEIPADRQWRNDWAVDPATLTDGTGADYGEGSLNEVVGWKPDGTPITRAAK